MRILLLSFYFQPDLCAGSYRASALVNSLLELLPEDTEIELITTLPNRYSTYTDEAVKREISDRLTVHRIALSKHQSGMVDQSLSFVSYVKGVMRLTLCKQYCLVVATSSRLMTAALGAYIAKRSRVPLYIDVRDIFVDTIEDVVKPWISWLIKPLLTWVQDKTFMNARRINLVSEGFLGYFRARYPLKEYSLFSNGIDKEFLEIPTRISKKTDQTNSQPLSVFYAGNIGEGQGMEDIIPKLAKRLEKRVHFTLVGDGGRRQKLQSQLIDLRCSNVTLLPPVNRQRLIELYMEADVLFLHLNRYSAFEKVLPSKIFEYAAVGKPIWAGVRGYAKKFILEEVSNATVFDPCDVEEAVAALSALSIRDTPREKFKSKFSRSIILTCAEHPAAADQTFLVSDGRDLCTAELLRLIGSVIDKPVRLFPVSPSVLSRIILLVGGIEIERKLLGNLQVDLTDTRRVLNWVPPMKMAR